MAGNQADWVSIGALLVSLFALWESIKANRQANMTQQQLVDIEKQREKDRQEQRLSAQLRAELRKKGNSYRLVIINQGNAEARNVRVVMDGKPLSENKVAVSGDRIPDVIGAHAEASCLLAISFENAPPFKIEIRWEDDSGNDREYQTTLTF